MRTPTDVLGDPKYTGCYYNKYGTTDCATGNNTTRRNLSIAIDSSRNSSIYQSGNILRPASRSCKFFIKF